MSYAGDDFYCDVAIPYPDRLEVVHQDERVLAFHHTRPFWRTHVVVVPVRHLASLCQPDEASRRLRAWSAERISFDAELSPIFPTLAWP